MAGDIKDNVKNSAGNDVNAITSTGNSSSNFINSTQNINLFQKDPVKARQTLQLQLENFLKGNIRVANVLSRNTGLPMVDRFDLFKAEILQEEVLVIIPEIYSQFHTLRLALEKANRMIDTAHTEYSKPHSPVVPNNNAVAAGYWIQQLKNHINHEILPVSLKLIGSGLIVSEDKMQL